MGIALIPMDDAAFQRFALASAAAYAEANVEAGRWPAELALERSRHAHAALLPQGLATPGQHLFTVHDTAAGDDVGVLWLSVSTTPDGERSGYVYDVWIDPPHRRRGHARAAFEALQSLALSMGLSEIELHVFAANAAAQALYRSLGYEVTGLNMRKRVA